MYCSLFLLLHREITITGIKYFETAKNFVDTHFPLILDFFLYYLYFYRIKLSKLCFKLFWTIKSIKNNTGCPRVFDMLLNNYRFETKHYTMHKIEENQDHRVKSDYANAIALEIENVQ